VVICKGVVKDNVVVLEENACLPDGAEVEVRVLPTAAEREEAFARVLAQREASTGLRVGMDEIIQEDSQDGERPGEQLSPGLRAFEADHVWVDTNRDVLLEQYSEQWIAVKNGQVIASDPDLDSLISKLPDPAHTCVEFLTRELMEVLL
jgi:hypothetical protein